MEERHKCTWQQIRLRGLRLSFVLLSLSRRYFMKDKRAGANDSGVWTDSSSYLSFAVLTLEYFTAVSKLINLGKIFLSLNVSWHLGKCRPRQVYRGKRKTTLWFGMVALGNRSQDDRYIRLRQHNISSRVRFPVHAATVAIKHESNYPFETEKITGNIFFLFLAAIF